MYFVYIQIPVYDAAYMYEIKTGLYRMLSWSPVCNKPIRNNYSLVQSNCSLIGFLTAISYSAMYIIHETAVTGKDCLFPPKNYVIYMNNTHFVRHWIVWCISRPIISPPTTACFISGMDTIVRYIAMIATTSWRSAERSTTRWVSHYLLDRYITYFTWFHTSFKMDGHG